MRIPGFPALVLAAFLAAVPSAAAEAEYRLLATRQTSTMEKEMNEAASEGYRLSQVMGGQTAFGGKEVVVAMFRDPSADSAGRFEYRLLATSQTSTMQEELAVAGGLGFGYQGQTVFETSFGGKEVVVILERNLDQPASTHEYLLLATLRTSTLEQEMQEAGLEGFELKGLTVGETRFGGREVLAILSRPGEPQAD